MLQRMAGPLQRDSEIDHNPARVNSGTLYYFRCPRPDFSPLPKAPNL